MRNRKSTHTHTHTQDGNHNYNYNYNSYLGHKGTSSTINHENKGFDPFNTQWVVAEIGIGVVQSSIDRTTVRGDSKQGISMLVTLLLDQCWRILEIRQIESEFSDRPNSTRVQTVCLVSRVSSPVCRELLPLASQVTYKHKELTASLQLARHSRLFVVVQPLGWDALTTTTTTTTTRPANLQIMEYLCRSRQKMQEWTQLDDTVWLSRLPVQFWSRPTGSRNLIEWHDWASTFLNVATKVCPAVRKRWSDRPSLTLL
jgi:hypothetical protein